MKKTFSITFFAAILAVGSAFANKATMRAMRTWMLWEGTLITAYASDIKVEYCNGGNTQVCAVDIEDGYNIIYRP